MLTLSDVTASNGTITFKTPLDFDPKVVTGNINGNGACFICYCNGVSMSSWYHHSAGGGRSLTVTSLTKTGMTVQSNPYPTYNSLTLFITTFD